MDPNFVYPALFKNQTVSSYVPNSGSLGLFASGNKFYALTTGGWGSATELINSSQTGAFGGAGDTGYLTGYVLKSQTGNIAIGTITLVIDGGGSAITTGYKSFTTVNYNGTIDSYTLLADQSGTLVIDIWKDSYANYPPTDADSITNGNEPHLTAVDKYTETCTGWSSTTITAGDVLSFNVDAAATVTKATLTLKILK